MRVVLLAVDNFVARAGLHKLLSAHERLKVVDSAASPDVVLIEIGPCWEWGHVPARYAPAPVVAVAHHAPGLVSRALLAEVTTCLTYGRFTETELVISRGFSNDEIARLLNVRLKTVKNRVNSIFSKLNARHRAEAVAIWLGAA